MESRAINPDFSNLHLGEATVQELQLELFRRSVVGRNSADVVIKLLLAHPHLWRGVIIDRLGVNEGGFWLQPSSMIKLRDVRRNHWNGDTLYLLCPARAAADEIRRLLEAEDLAAMYDVKDNVRELERALGARCHGEVILTAWWD